MRIVLLLLIALAGPFCTFIQASTLVVPTTFDVTTETVKEKPAVIATTEKSAPQEAASTPAPEVAASTSAPEEAASTVPVPEATKAAALTEKAPSVATESQDIQSDAPKGTAAPTDAAKATEAAPAEVATSGAPDLMPRAETEETGSESPDNVKIEGEEGMGTGQLVGIVIGALIGVIVVIAVIILVVRRMGQYSP